MLQVGPLLTASGAATVGCARWLAPALPQVLELPLLLVALLFYLAFLMADNWPLGSTLSLVAFAGSVGAAGGLWLPALDGSPWGRSMGFGLAELLAALLLGRRIRLPAWLGGELLTGLLWLYLLGWPAIALVRGGPILIRSWAAFGSIVLILLATVWSQDLRLVEPPPAPRMAGELYLITFNLILAMALLLPPA